MGDQMLGMITASPYSAAHDSALNKAYVSAFEKANNFRPDFVSLGGYDGMHLIYEALKRTAGSPDGDAVLAAMKGMAWESPRGPMSIDPQTRDDLRSGGRSSESSDEINAYAIISICCAAPSTSSLGQSATF